MCDSRSRPPCYLVGTHAVGNERENKSEPKVPENQWYLISLLTLLEQVYSRMGLFHGHRYDGLNSVPPEFIW